MATRDDETVIYEERDGVAWITLNRPEEHDAVNSLMQREVRELESQLHGGTESVGGRLR